MAKFKRYSRIKVVLGIYYSKPLLMIWFFSMRFICGLRGISVSLMYARYEYGIGVIKLSFSADV